MELSLQVSEAEQYEHLVNDLKAIVGEKRKIISEELRSMKWEIGQAIVTSPLYKKHAKGNRKLILQLAATTQIQDSEIYACVKYFEVAPSEKEKESYDSKLEKNHWSDIKKALVVQPREPVTPHCTHCKIHCPKIWLSKLKSRRFVSVPTSAGAPRIAPIC